MATCYRHPDRETNVGCSNCGRPICPDCMTSTPVGMRCPECGQERTRVHRAPAGLAGGAAPVTMTLIGLNLLAFLAELATGAGLFRGGGDAFNEGALFGPAVDGGEPYRIVTAGFLHYGLLHLGLNMFVLYFLGRLLEPAIGPWRFTGIYLVSVLGGSFGALLIDPLAVTVGASGGVFGLMAATFFIARQRGMDDLASQIGILVAINLVFTFGIESISIGGHLGGLVAGALAGLAIIQGARRGRRGRLLDAAALAALAAVAIVGSLIAAAESVQSPFG